MYKQEKEFYQRINETIQIRAKHPDRIPIIVEPTTDNILPLLDKHKYLVSNEMTLGQFAYTIRKRIRLSQDQAMFLFVNNVLPPTSSTIGGVYHEHKDADGFLYLSYAGENTFG